MLLHEAGAALVSGKSRLHIFSFGHNESNCIKDLMSCRPFEMQRCIRGARLVTRHPSSLQAKVGHEAVRRRIAAPSALSVPQFSTRVRRQHQHGQTSPSSSIDPTEVTHFNALASAWWDPHGSSRLLHLMNPMRHQFIKQCLASQADAPASQQKLDYLDIGCGGGIFAESAARLHNTSSVTALDPTPEVFKVAEAHKRRDPMLCQAGKLTYLNIGIEDLSKNVPSQKQYDIVSVFEVIEHVNKPSEFLDQVLPHVKPGGWLIMSTIARTWTSWLICFEAASRGPIAPPTSGLRRTIRRRGRAPSTDGCELVILVC